MARQNRQGSKKRAFREFRGPVRVPGGGLTGPSSSPRGSPGEEQPPFLATLEPASAAGFIGGYNASRPSPPRVWTALCSLQRLQKRRQKDPPVPFLPSLPAFYHPHPLKLQQEQQKQQQHAEEEQRVGPLPDKLRRGLAFALRTLEKEPQKPKPSHLALLRLVLQHEATDVYTIAANLPEQSGNQPQQQEQGSEQDLEQKHLQRRMLLSSPFLRRLEALRFPSLLRLSPRELMLLLQRRVQLLCPGGAEAAEGAATVLLREEGWTAAAVKKWLLQNPKAFKSNLPIDEAIDAAAAADGAAAEAAASAATPEAAALEPRASAAAVRTADAAAKVAAEAHRTAAAACMRERLARWKQLGFSSAQLQQMALQRPQLLQQQQPEKKLKHIFKVWLQVLSTRPFFWGGEDDPLVQQQHQQEEDQQQHQQEEDQQQQHDDQPKENIQWLPWWKGEGPPPPVEQQQQEHPKASAVGGPPPGGPLLVPQGDGLLLKEVFPGEEEAAAAGEEAAAAARAAALARLEQQSSRVQEAQKQLQEQLRQLVLQHPRLLSVDPEGSLKAKLLYVQNCMYTRLQEVLEWPQALTYGLYTRIVPRHLALVNEFLIRTHAARRPHSIDEGEEAKVYRQFSQDRNQWKFREQLLQEQPLHIARRRLQLLLLQQQQQHSQQELEEAINRGNSPLSSMLVLPLLHPQRGWRGLEPYQPLWCPPLPPLRLILRSTDSAFCQAFRIPYRRFLEAKHDAQQVRNPQRLF
ncbi:uncharacterized protein LOC113146765 [Cyclospora cayetanensis]|uniref:Uncharacterized protein LOC113146765 n=1 Tax=Cyclospora cayetanensis TaxID=88456 RepID=A0A6P6RTI8_9EIME|nr:uncharacterized protein LOC113146765 [Cyclospora cayetanensis]